MLKIRPATPADTQQIFDFIVELAIYERAEHEVKSTPNDLHNNLFNESPKAFALICEQVTEGKAQAIGFALYFYNYSTWLGKHGIYLEDLYVTPEARGLGAGKQLLKRLAQIAVSEGLGRVEWSVLDWNEPAINFYLSLGAKPQDEWTVYRLTDQAMNEFGAQD